MLFYIKIEANLGIENRSSNTSFSDIGPLQYPLFKHAQRCQCCTNLHI